VDVEAGRNAKYGWDTVWETWIPEKSTGNSDFEEVSPHPLLTIIITPPVSFSSNMILTFLNFSGVST